ncbi:uncharacterized protein PFLUO_LOCUS5076 [Penicillium psychrofluorescens]|uniref:uncharacterized protein n=1 Tax=Penicillium psychrofluorescens TaxID=3158075 RepID=UPI003CCD5027
MGATHSSHLTPHVTHLLVGDPDTEKYKYVARHRNDVAVVKPEWIEAVRQPWMQGEDTDIRALQEQHKYPVFGGLTICITGFEDKGFRKYMEQTAMENGAEFRTDLTKSVTHLVARNGEGEKYKYATQWNVTVVTLKWFTDCLERGMILDANPYHPMVPLEKQGAGAWERPSVAAKGQSENERTASVELSSNPRPRKLRRTASTKLVGQNEGIWGDIVGTGFATHQVKGFQSGQQQERDGTSSRSVPVIQAAMSFASETTFSGAVEAPQPPPETKTTTSAEGFLQGSYFLISGFSSKQTGVLRHHLQFNGAQLVDSLSEFSRPSIPKTGRGLYIMVPYKTPRSEIPSTDDMAFECEIVTDMWLERCLDARTLVPPESHVASTPFPKFPIPGFSGMRICSTGFARIDLLHLSKLVDLMGASYDEFLTPKASVLICNDPQSASHEKLRHTSEWGVSAVSADWLWISIQTGQKKPFEPYIVRRPLSRSGSGAEKPSSKPSSVHVDRQQQQKANAQAERASNSGSDSAQNRRADRRVASRKSDTNLGDGFSKEDQPKPDNPFKPSVPASRSPSPGRTSSKDDSAAKLSKSNQSASAAAPSALDIAMSGLLQQARAAKSRAQTDTTTSATNEDGSYPPRRKRKPLLGRAPSHSSTRVFEAPGGAGGGRAVSRASSIDTLNDDGVGSALESNPTRDNSMSRTNSRANEQSLSSMFSGGKLENFLADQFPSHLEAEDEENHEPPPMTQLDYEDSDAAAMRAEFLSRAGKLPGKKSAVAAPDPGVSVGQVRELEDIGWGSKRRTRKAATKADDEDGLF